MKILGRNFFLGVGAGIVLTISVLVSGGILLTRTIFNSETLQQVIEAPPIPYTASADYNWTVQSLDGQYLKFEEMKGRVVFLNFWATWCAPCLAEMPSIQRLYEMTKDKGIAFLCITQEDHATVNRFVKEQGYTFPVYLLAGDLPESFKTDIIPATYILSRNGRVAFKHAGAAKWDAKVSVAFLESLTKEN